MSTFTITSNSYLRSLYRSDRSLATKKGRADATNAELLGADAAALKNGVGKLAGLDYGDSRKDSTIEKNRLFMNLQAFQDAYNNTIKSSSDSENDVAKSDARKIKQLAKKYSDELSELGVTFDEEKGYMKVRNSAVDNIDVSKYEKVFGKDSDFSKELSKLSKRLAKHIDYQA